jgi:hypothetical protein
MVAACPMSWLPALGSHELTNSNEKGTVHLLTQTCEFMSFLTAKYNFFNLKTIEIIGIKLNYIELNIKAVRPTSVKNITCSDLKQRVCVCFYRCECDNPVGLVSFFFFLVPWGGVRLGPLATSADNWPIVSAPDDRWWVWSSRWNQNWRGKPKY